MFDGIVLVGAGKTSGTIAVRLAHIAPLTIVDLSAAALEPLAARPQEQVAGRHPIATRVADGTSRLVLEDLRGDADTIVGLVVAPGDDRATIESCKLGAELGYKPIVAIVQDREGAELCEKHGARAVVRAEIVGQLVAQLLQQGGFGIASAIGSGQGEIVEFTVLPSSPAIGVPFVKLDADTWRIAAIYRGTELVLPRGSTRLAAGDRVLIVGDPKQLPHVVESMRVGLPTFPLLHGPNVVVYLPAGPDEAIETEAKVLALTTRATKLVRAIPGAKATSSVMKRSPGDEGSARKYLEDAPLEGVALAEHASSLAARQPGVVVARTTRRRMFEVLLGRGGQDSTLCNALAAPVLFPKGEARHERIVLCLGDGASAIEAAEVALDLARMFGVPLLVLRVNLPGYLQAPDPAIDALVETVTQRARLHGMHPEVRIVEGNPIAEWTNASTPTDLAVVSRARSMRDSFSGPDLALRLVRASRGSVLVITVKG